MVGMGRELCTRSAAARRVFEAADRVLGFALSRICFEGPEEDLRRTDHAQPAILTASVALLEAAREVANPIVMNPPAFVAGHSLGEFTAIVVAGGLDFADGVRLVRERGWLMEQAARSGENGMVAVLGLDADTVAAICEEVTSELRGEVVQVANLNTPDQTIISGTQPALVRAAERAKIRGARRIHPLAVAGAFHSPVMAAAESEFRRHLDRVPFRDCEIPVVANVTAQPIRTAAEVRAELGAQITAPVRWQGSVETMVSAGVSRFVEVGEVRVLGSMIKRIYPDATVECP